MLLSVMYLMAFTWYDSPIIMTVPFNVGGPTDAVARHVEMAIENNSAIKIAVINQGGASGNVGLREFAKKQSGLLFTTENIFTNKKYLTTSYPHNLIDTITPIYFFGKLPNIIYAHNKIKNFSHLIEEASHRDILIGSAAPGSGSFETYHQLCKTHNILKQCRVIIYKSAGDAIIDLIAGRLDIYSSLYPAYNTFTGMGTVSPILVLSKTRLKSLPDIPTSFEFNLEIENVSWHGLFAKGLDGKTIAEITRSLDIYFTAEKKEKFGYEALDSDHTEFWQNQKNFYENLYRK